MAISTTPTIIGGVEVFFLQEKYCFYVIFVNAFVSQVLCIVSEWAYKAQVAAAICTRTSKVQKAFSAAAQFYVTSKVRVCVIG